VQPDAVVFDLDGTLAHTAADIREALNAVLGCEQLPAVDIDAVQRMIGGGPEELVRRALHAFNASAGDERVTRLTKKLRERFGTQGNRLSHLLPGAQQCLDYLSGLRISIGLCSNKPEANCTQLLEDLNIRQYFDVVQGSGSGLPLKPDPTALLATVKRLGARQVLYVGDSATDVATANAAGVPVALVRGGYCTEAPEFLDADWILDELSQLPTIWHSN
jgi:phosphoglycolate phosphatase